MNFGLELFEKRQIGDALEVFEKGLQLPGSGTARDRAKPRELTRGERRTLLYNISCCQSELGDFPKALNALEGAIDAGLDNLQYVEEDASMDALRETEGYATLIEKYASQLRRQSDVEGEMTFAQYMEYQFSFKNSATGRFLKRMGQSFEK